MNNTLVVAPIPIKKGEEVVIIPRRIYDRYFAGNNISGKYDKFYEELNAGLTTARKQHLNGKSYGPFGTVTELMKSLRK